MKRFLAALAIVLALCLLPILPSCKSDLTPQTKQTVSSGHNAAAVQAGKIQDQAKVNQANGNANPLAHPIDNANNQVKKAQPIFLLVAILATLGFGVGFALAFTGLAPLGKLIRPICAGLAATCWAMDLLLPFFPAALYLGIMALLVWAAIEIIIHKSFKGGVEAVEADLGLTPAPSTPVASTTAASPAVSPSAPVAAADGIVSKVETTVESIIKKI
jgi:hypothetical protein